MARERCTVAGLTTEWWRAVWHVPHRLFGGVLIDADAGEGELEPDTCDIARIDLAR